MDLEIILFFKHKFDFSKINHYFWCGRPQQKRVAVLRTHTRIDKIVFNPAVLRRGPHHNATRERHKVLLLWSVWWKRQRWTHREPHHVMEETVMNQSRDGRGRDVPIVNLITWLKNQWSTLSRDGRSSDEHHRQPIMGLPLEPIVIPERGSSPMRKSSELGKNRIKNASYFNKGKSPCMYESYWRNLLIRLIIKKTLG